MECVTIRPQWGGGGGGGGGGAGGDVPPPMQSVKPKMLKF